MLSLTVLLCSLLVALYCLLFTYFFLAFLFFYASFACFLDACALRLRQGCKCARLKIKSTAYDNATPDNYTNMVLMLFCFDCFKL